LRLSPLGERQQQVRIANVGEEPKEVCDGIQIAAEWLEILREDGILKTVNGLLSWCTNCGSRQKSRWQVLRFFEDVSGTAMPIVAGIASSRKMFARALGVSVDELVETFSTAQSNPGDYIMVERESAPVKEVIEPEVDLHKLPIPTHHEKDGGPYITAGVLVSRDPSTGIRNLSIHRLQVLEKNRLGILILPSICGSSCERLKPRSSLWKWQFP